MILSLVPNGSVHTEDDVTMVMFMKGWFNTMATLLAVSPIIQSYTFSTDTHSVLEKAEVSLGLQYC